MSDQDLALRIQQIIFSGAEKRASETRAVEQALRERFPAPDQYEDLMRATVQFYVASHRAMIRALKHSTMELKDPAQGCLFDIPSVICIEKDDDTYFISRDVATMGEVREWNRLALQHHSVQRLRFQRLAKELESVDGLDDGMLWPDAFKVLEERQKELQEAERENEEN